ATPLTVADGDVLLSGAWGRLLVVGPARRLPARTTTNDGCLVLLLDTAYGRVLLPGDRETPGVDALLAAHPALLADVLVLPHHGHFSLGRDRLVRACGARVLLSSAPRSAAAVQPEGTRLTGIEGALSVELRPGGPVVVPLTSAGEGAARGYDPARGAPRPTMADSLTLLVAALVLAVIAVAAWRLSWLTPAGSAARRTTYSRADLSCAGRAAGSRRSACSRASQGARSRRLPSCSRPAFWRARASFAPSGR